MRLSIYHTLIYRKGRCLLETFLADRPDTKLIVIDTLQKIRENYPDTNSYSSDYRDIGLLKTVSDKHVIAIIAVQHL